MTPLTEFGHGFAWGIVAGAALLFTLMAVAAQLLIIARGEDDRE